MKPAYDWFVEGSAYHYLVNLTKRRRHSLERSLDHLASHPFQSSLYTSQAADGARLDTIEAEGHLVTYHADHAVRRIWVTEIHHIS